MRMWIDVGDCPERFHLIQTRDDEGDRYEVLHHDNKQCAEAEFKVEEDGE